MVSLWKSKLNFNFSKKVEEERIHQEVRKGKELENSKLKKSERMNQAKTSSFI
jgi:hypothetical protein